MFTTSVERSEGTTVKLTVTVPAEGVEKAVDEAYGRIGSKLRIPGFRKGKAPRPVVDNFAGRDYILAEATEILVNDWYPQAVDAEGLRPIESPELGDLDLVRPGEQYTFKFDVETRPELELESYDDITVEVPRREVNESDIQEKLDELRQRFASLGPVEDRGVAADDFVLVSFVGYVADEPYEGNEVDKYLYEMGKGLMPPEFDEGILGMEPGTEGRVEFVIPDTSNNPDYVGKMAQFDVTVHEIKAKKLPEVDDNFAAEMGFESVELMMTDTRSRLDLERMLDYNRTKEKAAREELARRTPGVIPEPMIKGRMESLEADFNARLRDQGITLEQYASMAGLTREVFESQLSKDADQAVREDLALEALFRQLGMEVTDADIDQELEDLASATKTTPEEAREKWKSMGLMAVIAEGVMHRKAVGWLMENVKTVEIDSGGETTATEKPAEGTKKTAKKRAPKKKDESAVAGSVPPKATAPVATEEPS